MLEEVYNLVKENRIDAAIDVAFEGVDNLCSAEDFGEVDKVLKSLDLVKLDINLTVAFLSITLAAKDELKYRETFYERCRERLLVLCPERLDKVLGGLR